MSRSIALSCLALLAGCHGDPVGSAPDSSGFDAGLDASGDASVDGTVTDGSPGDLGLDTTALDGTPGDAGGFEVPKGDAACADGKAPAPEAGSGGCPADMVALPAGGFEATSVARSASFPKGFCADVTEVTVDAYQAKCATSGCVPSTACSGTYGVAGKGSHPVTCVTWEQADAHCKAVGKRLPTELEWEYAQRGAPKSGAGTQYPWGDALDAADTCHLCWGPSSGGKTCAVGSFPAGNSPQGVMDLSGGVEEWTSTLEGSNHVRRGGSWDTTDALSCGADSGRGGDSGADKARGFRCVKSLP